MTESRSFIDRAKDAIDGHQLDIINHKGIEWPPARNGVSHISCPYPNHPGNPDHNWRYDERRKKAVCTCVGYHDVFDVLTLLRGGNHRNGVEGKRSAVEALQIIGRHDLAEEGNQHGRSDIPWHEWNKQDRMLHPPADLRDDNIARTFLAARLGIDPDDVVMPSTPWVGIRALEYYENRKVIGTFPAAAFAQIDLSTGEITGVIIEYIDPSLTKKAKLGREGDQPNGNWRTSKKFAREYKPGGAVVFGKIKAPIKAPCEGVATGAAIAYAAASVGNGNIAVLCGGTAAGMTAIKLNDITSNDIIERLAIAADRDEESRNGRPPGKAGEHHARLMAEKHRHLPVSIGLPGQPGQKIDWLDVLSPIRSGVVQHPTPDTINAVYHGVFEAPILNIDPSETIPPENPIPESSPEPTDRLDYIRKTYPLPDLDGFMLEYRRTRNGKVRIHKSVKVDEDGNPVWYSACSPISVPKRLLVLDGKDGPGYGLRIRIEDMSGNPRELDISRSAIAKAGGQELKAMLLSAGLRAELDGESVALAILKTAEPEDEVMVVSKPGWHRLDGLDHPIYVTPTGEVIGLPNGAEVELAINLRLAGKVGVAGSFDEWKAITRTIASIENVPHWTLALCASFAGVLIDLLGFDSVGLCLTGETSRGKSTSQMMAVSPWSNPKLGAGGLFYTARNTTNAAEALAQRSNGTIFALDELKHLRGDAVSSLIYMIAGNAGKGRMSADASLRSVYSWKTFAILSAEKTLQAAVREGGGDWMPGVAVRIPDVNVSGVNANVPVDTMSEIKRIEQHYGHAGPEFVRQLVKSNFHIDTDTLRRKIDDLSKKIAGTSKSELIRAALPFAVLSCAGETAKTVGILPDNLDIASAVQWGWQQYRANNETGIDRQANAVSVVNAWLASHWNVSVVSVDEQAPKRAVEAWYDNDFIFISSDKLKEVIPQTITVSDFLKTIKSGDMIKPFSDNRLAHKRARGKETGTCYWLKRTHFGPTAGENEEYPGPDGGNGVFDEKVVNFRNRIR